jgi:N-acetylglutamate synthase-like GNAT family acetyltransferase
MHLRAPNNARECEAYYHFRWQLLRQPLSQPLGSERDEFEAQAIHCLAMIDEQIVGVGRVHMDTQHSAQIRYMAVHPEHQKTGVGRSMINYLLAEAEQSVADYVWCNAREDAVGFYLRCGFKALSSVQTDLEIPHTRMQLDLNGD